MRCREESQSVPDGLVQTLDFRPEMPTLKKTRVEATEVLDERMASGTDVRAGLSDIQMFEGYDAWDCDFKRWVNVTRDAVLFMYVEEEPAKEFMGAVAPRPRPIAGGGMTLSDIKQEAAEAVRNGLNVLASLRESLRFAAASPSEVAPPQRQATERPSVTVHRHGGPGGSLALTWLHLSDFHIRVADSYDRDVVLRALVRSVRRFRAQGHSPDVAFATGDVAFSGKSGEYQIATAFFDDLLDAAGLERRDLFVIPGNHDVDRDLGVGLARTLLSQEESDLYFAPGSPRPHLTQKQGAFLAWYHQFFAGIRECPVSSCGPVELVEAGGCRVGVLPINSAFFSQDDHDHAKLWVGRRSLDAAVKDLGELDAHLRIALIHHPLDWLADLERENIHGKLAENVDVLLRGHLHEAGVQQVVSPQGELVHLAGGAAYQTRRWPNRALYVTLKDSSLSVFPIRYEDSPTEVWTVDPSVFPNEPQHMGLVPIPAKSPQPVLERAEEATPARASLGRRAELTVVFDADDPECVQIRASHPQRDAQLRLRATNTGNVGLTGVRCRLRSRHDHIGRIRHDNTPPYEHSRSGTTLQVGAKDYFDIAFCTLDSLQMIIQYADHYLLREQLQNPIEKASQTPVEVVIDGRREDTGEWLPTITRHYVVAPAEKAITLIETD